MNPFSDTPSAVAGGTCAVCGQRPGTMRVVASDGVQRRAATVCEPCANRLMAAQAQGGMPGAQPQPDAPQSDTPRSTSSVATSPTTPARAGSTR